MLLCMIYVAVSSETWFKNSNYCVLCKWNHRKRCCYWWTSRGRRFLTFFLLLFLRKMKGFMNSWLGNQQICMQVMLEDFWADAASKNSGFGMLLTVGYLPGLKVEALPLLRPRKVSRIAFFGKWYLLENISPFSDGIMEWCSE